MGRGSSDRRVGSLPFKFLLGLQRSLFLAGIDSDYDSEMKIKPSQLVENPSVTDTELDTGWRVIRK